MKSFGAESLESFHRCKGVLWGVGGVVLSALGFYVAPTSAVPIQWAIPIAMLFALSVHCLWDLAVRCYAEAKPPPPRVIQGRPSARGGVAVLLIDAHPAFYIEQHVAFFVLDGSFEVLVGVGYVLNIQGNGLIQVEVVQEADGNKKLWPGAKDNNFTILTSLIVKPGAPKTFYDQLRTA